MKNNARARYLPIVMIPAGLPAVLLPAMVAFHVPANVAGGAMGFSIGLALVGVGYIAKGARLRRS